MLFERRTNVFVAFSAYIYRLYQPGAPRFAAGVWLAGNACGFRCARFLYGHRDYGDFRLHDNFQPVFRQTFPQTGHALGDGHQRFSHRRRVAVVLICKRILATHRSRDPLWFGRGRDRRRSQ